MGATGSLLVPTVIFASSHMADVTSPVSLPACGPSGLWCDFLEAGSAFKRWMNSRAGFSLVILILTGSVWISKMSGQQTLYSKRIKKSFTSVVVLTPVTPFGTASAVLTFSLRHVKRLCSQTRLSGQRSRGATSSPRCLLGVCMSPYMPINVSVFPLVSNCLCGFTLSPPS